MIRSYEFLNQRECTVNFHTALRSSRKVFCPFATSARIYGSPLYLSCTALSMPMMTTVRSMYIKFTSQHMVNFLTQPWNRDWEIRVQSFFFFFWSTLKVSPAPGAQLFPFVYCQHVTHLTANQKKTSDQNFPVIYLPVMSKTSPRFQPGANPSARIKKNKNLLLTEDKHIVKLNVRFACGGALPTTR